MDRVRFIDYEVNKEQTVVTILKYEGERSLTNLMPELSKVLREIRPTLLYIEYVDSDGEPTLYNINMDHYSPLPKE